MIAMAAYVQPPSGINVRRIVERCLQDIGWTQKVAALSVREDYEPTLSRGLAGLGPLDLNAMATWPAQFWWKFARRMVAAALRRDEQLHEEERRRAC